jgi:Holliday junction resolvase RusA-like endonuclease
MIIYEVVGDPTPWAAPRKGRNGFYNPKHLQKGQAIWQLKSQVNHESLSEALYIDVHFYMPIPKSTSGIRKRQMLNGMIHPKGKPDVTNMEKFIEDCLQEAGAISNDSIIVKKSSSKQYGEVPKTVIMLKSIETLQEREKKQ